MEETEEQQAKRAEKFLRDKQDLEGYIEPYTEAWYRHKYPGFPEHFYPIFEQFSNQSAKETIVEEP